MKILQVNASARTLGSNSTRLADGITARLLALYPGAQLVRRDLASEPQPLLDEAAMQALATPAERRTPEQAARVAADDAVIAQVRQADVIVLGVPMYNFGVSTQLKSWIDALTRAGVTFRYTDRGPEGLLQGKKAYVALARGGLYRDTQADLQVPWLKKVLGFVGIDEVEFIYAEGLAMGPAASARGLAEAEEQIHAIAA